MQRLMYVREMAEKLLVFLHKKIIENQLVYGKVWVLNLATHSIHFTSGIYNGELWNQQ